MSSINSLVNAVNAKGNAPGVMKRWSDQIAAAGGNDNLLQTQVRQQTALLVTLNALFSGDRRDDLMLKGGNIYGGLTSDSGLPPTLESLYDDPSLKKEYTFGDAIPQSLACAAVRPRTPGESDL